MFVRKQKLKGVHSRVDNRTVSNQLEKKYLHSVIQKLFHQEEVNEVEALSPEESANTLYNHLEWIIYNRIQDIKHFNLPTQPLKDYDEFTELERFYVDLIDTYQYLEQQLKRFKAEQDILSLKDHLPQFKSTLARMEEFLELSINWQQIQSLLNEHSKQIERTERNLATSFALEHVVLEEMEKQLEQLSYSAIAISECIDLLSEKEVDTTDLSAQYFDLMNHLMYLQEQIHDKYELTIPESIF